ncbi:MAG: hypothetical protein H7Z38_03015 [Rubrivivax sp.]|nr:hypothetical protein [Pyrinomonadaceae bacterium]
MTVEQSKGRQTERKTISRRNRRINIRFPVWLAVPSEDERTQALQAHTVVVSHAGATLEVDDLIPVGMGLQVSPPFGGTILAEVSDAWVDDESGKNRISIRLLDPVAWTSPERFSVPGCVVTEWVRLGIHPRLGQMLADYTDYLNATEGGGVTQSVAAESILEKAFLSDGDFQNWLAAKIMDDLSAWEESYVRPR